MSAKLSTGKKPREKDFKKRTNKNKTTKKQTKRRQRNNEF
jgi:hypothetical protein